MYPFTERHHGNVRIRTFEHDVDDSELIWHRDAEDRHVHVLESKGWYLQFDGSLPMLLSQGDRHSIRKHTWHRVIKKKDAGKLVVEVIIT